MTDGPPELLARVAEWARHLSERDWEMLAALYHPDYRGRRGVARYLSISEELDRLREETECVAAAGTHCHLTPLSVAVEGDIARLLVEERMERTAKDGCRRVSIRRFEQIWSFAGGRWLLFQTERVPRAERSYREAAFERSFWDLLNWAGSLLDEIDSRGFGGSRFGSRMTRAILNEIRRVVPAQIVTVQVDAGVVTGPAVLSLQRASEAAVEAWNRTLEGAAELRLHAGPEVPDILIRGWDRPIHGTTLGLAMPAAGCRLSGRQARIAEVRVVLVRLLDGVALPPDPADLYGIICHELGHCFGLGHCAGERDCTGAGSVMGPKDWFTEPPAGPFLAERRVILRWLAAAHRLLARAHSRLGETEQANADEERAADLRLELDRDPLGSGFPVDSLEIEPDAMPLPVRLYWEGNAAIRRRSFEQALACYQQVMAEGIPYPEVMLLRSWLRGRGSGQDRESLEELKRAVQVAPSWAPARERVVHFLLRYGRRHEAAVHQAVLRRLACREKIEEEWQTARTARQWRYGGVAGGRAAGWMVRYAAAWVGEQIVKTDRRKAARGERANAS